MVAETDVGGVTADFVFSSTMDAQVMLANDGYGQREVVPESAGWPRWANWCDMAYALTFEPGVLVYHRPSFPDSPPTSRLALMQWLAGPGLRQPGRIGTYDIERSAVGYLFLAQDAEYFSDIWTLVQAPGCGRFRPVRTSSTGWLMARWCWDTPFWGAMPPIRCAHGPIWGWCCCAITPWWCRGSLWCHGRRTRLTWARFLGFLISRDGQELLSDKLRLPAISLEVSGENSSAAMTAALGDVLRPVTVSPGLLVYLNQAKRARIMWRWRAGLELPPLSGD